MKLNKDNQQDYSEYQELMERTLGKQRISNDFDSRATRNLEERKRAAEDSDTTGKQLTQLRLGYNEEDEEYVVPPETGFFNVLSNRMGAAPWWFISGTFHALLLLLVTLIGIVILGDKNQDVVIVMDLEKQKEPEEEKELVKRDIIPKPVDMESEVEVDEPTIITHEEVEIADQVETENDSDAADTVGENGVSDVFLGGSGTVASLGLGGGGGGAFGRPNGAGGRLRRATRGGGSKKTESAVDAALAWLARHQEADGHWDMKKHGGGNNVSGGRAYQEGVSALAMLAFLGAGHTEKIGKYKDVVSKAQNWLINSQASVGDGKGYQAYSLALTTLALAESYAMAKNPKAKDAAQKGLDRCLRIQQPHGGWNHGGFKSTSVLGWFVMALKSAKVAGLKVPATAFESAIKRLETIGNKDADGYWGKIGYVSKNSSPYCKGMSMTAVGMVSLQFMGFGEETANQAEMLCQEPPVWMPNAGVREVQNFYHWYYSTLGIFQHGGAKWKTWNEALKTALIPNQRQGGPKDGSLQDMDGSWDHAAGWAPTGGRVYSTAMGALILEVYYRYLPIYR